MVLCSMQAMLAHRESLIAGERYDQNRKFKESADVGREKRKRKERARS